MQNNPWGSDPYATRPLRQSGGGPGRGLTGALLAALLVVAGLNGNLSGLGIPGLSLPPQLASLGQIAQQVTGDPTPGGRTSRSTPTTAPVNNSADDDAIKQVVQTANDAQVQAFKSGDPTVMQDTATADYYQQMVDTNQGLAGQGVTGIALVNLSWGLITVNGTSATVTTTETWSTTLNDGSTERDVDKNVYTLVQQAGTWKVQDDQHPDDTSSGTSPGTSQPSPQTPSIPSIPAIPLPGLPGRGSVSQNWSGYTATGAGYSGVSATWVVPEPAAGGVFGTDAEWVGIGGVRSRDLIQAGTEATVVSSGHIVYDAWSETLPQTARTVALSVNPGDSVTVSLANQDADSWDVHITDNTTGQDYEKTVQYTSSGTSAEWVVEAPSASRGRQLPLDDFGSVAFTDASAIKNGNTVNINQAGARAITMVDVAGRSLAEPSSINADGAGFQVNRTSTPSVSPSPGRQRGGSGGTGGSGNGGGSGPGSNGSGPGSNGSGGGSSVTGTLGV